MNCRIGCGACCIAISISSALPGMPAGKPAGVRCIHLTPDNICMLHDQTNYPPICKNLKPAEEMCGRTFAEAMDYLTRLEKLTQPEP